MKELIQGIVDFRKSLTEENRALFAKLAHEQKPKTLFITCSDSRVVPNLFAHTFPGDLFVLRNIGNFIPPASLAFEDHCSPAVIEFSIFALHVSDIIVCGHSECGAIRALLQGHGIDPVTCPHLEFWLKYGKESLDKAKNRLVFNPQLLEHNQTSQINVLKQMEHVASYPFVRERLKTGQLQIHGWWFDIARADVYCYEPESNQFVLIDEEQGKLMIDKLNRRERD